MESMKFLAVIGSLGVMVSGATPVPHPALFLDLCVVLSGDLAPYGSTYCIPRMAPHPFRRLPLSWSYRGCLWKAVHPSRRPAASAWYDVSYNRGIPCHWPMPTAHLCYEVGPLLGVGGGHQEVVYHSNDQISLPITL